MYDTIEEDERFMINMFAEKEWKDSLPPFNFKYLSETFPEAKEAYIEMLEREIRNAELDLKQAETNEKLIDDAIFRLVPIEVEEFWRMILYGLYVDGLRLNREKTIKAHSIHIAFLKGKKISQKGGVTDIQIERAREHPIHELLDFKNDLAKCLWHTEAHGSLHYYRKGNRVHCFGACGRSRDAVDVYMQLHGVDFINAVKALQ